jgi:hypothetical protein
MKMLSSEEYELLRMPNVTLDDMPECKSTDRQAQVAEALVEFKRSRWVWSDNPGGPEYLLLEDSEWTEKALRVYELVHSLT